MDVDRSDAPEILKTPSLAPLVRYGGPLALGMAAHGLFNVVDLVIVGRLGEGAVAAVTAAGIVNMATMLLFNGVVTLLAAHVARLHGAGRTADADRASSTSLGLTGLASIVLGVPFFLAAGPLTAFVLADGATADSSASYLRIMSLGSATMFFLLHATTVLRARGESMVPMAALIGSNALNVVLDVLLVFGLLGFPRLETDGAAWATVIARGAGALWVLSVLARGRHGVRIDWRAVARPLEGVGEYVVRGLVSAVQLVARVAATYLLLGIARGVVGSAEHVRDMLDGVGVCIRLEMVVVFMGLGWGSAAGTAVGQGIGAGLTRAAARATWCYCGLAAGSALLLGATCAIWGPKVLELVAPEMAPRAFEEAAVYLAWNVPAWAPLLLAIVLSQALNGAGSTRTGLVLDTAVYLLIVPFLATRLGAAHGVAGCWAALVIGHVLAALAFSFIFRGGRWKHRPAGGADGFESVRLTSRLAEGERET